MRLLVTLFDMKATQMSIGREMPETKRILRY
jgi:hypothetical protein